LGDLALFGAEVHSKCVTQLSQVAGH
jgi:hypothetical protein